MPRWTARTHRPSGPSSNDWKGATEKSSTRCAIQFSGPISMEVYCSSIAIAAKLANPRWLPCETASSKGDGRALSTFCVTHATTSSESRRRLERGTEEDLEDPQGWYSLRRRLWGRGKAVRHRLRQEAQGWSGATDF